MKCVLDSKELAQIVHKAFLHGQQNNLSFRIRRLLCSLRFQRSSFFYPNKHFFFFKSKDEATIQRVGFKLWKYTYCIYYEPLYYKLK